MFGLTPALTMEREVLSKANLGFLAQRSCGFFPPSLPNALIQTPPSLKAFVNTMALDKKAMAVTQSYGGQVIFAKELSMIMRF